MAKPNGKGKKHLQQLREKCLYKTCDAAEGFVPNTAADNGTHKRTVHGIGDFIGDSCIIVYSAMFDNIMLRLFSADLNICLFAFVFGQR